MAECLGRAWKREGDGLGTRVVQVDLMKVVIGRVSDIFFNFKNIFMGVKDIMRTVETSNERDY